MKDLNIGSRIGESLINALGHLPLRVLYSVSDVLAPLLHYVVRYRLKVVRKNLSLSFPELDDGGRHKIESSFYRYFCDLTVEVIRWRAMPPDEVRRCVTFTNLQLVEDSLADHDFALCYLGHYGNWEWLCGLPLWLQWGGMCQIYHPLYNKVFDRWFLDGRSRFGAVNIPMKHTLKQLLTLRQAMASGEDPHRGYMFGCIADQLPKRENIHFRLPFLHQDTGVFTGAEKIGRKFGMSWFYARITRPERGRYEVTFEAMDNVDPASGEFAYTAEYMRRFEQDIRLHPEIWLWTHDRWKR